MLVDVLSWGWERGWSVWGVRTDVLVVAATTHDEDLSGNGVEHRCVAAHGVCVAGAGAGRGLAAGAGGVVPVHGDGGAGLEDVLVFPGEKHGVVVGSVDACG